MQFISKYINYLFGRTAGLSVIAPLQNAFFAPHGKSFLRQLCHVGKKIAFRGGGLPLQSLPQTKVAAKLCAVTIILAFLFVSISCEEITEPSNGDYIKIGVLMPHTGSMSLFGMDVRKGLELAAYQINQQGGVLGKNIDLIVKDTEASPTTALEMAKQFDDDNVVAIIGAAASSSTKMVATDYAIPEGMLMISPCSTSPIITNIEDSTGTDLIFRTVISDAVSGEIASQGAFAYLKSQTAGVIYIDNIYGQGLAANFKAGFEAFGGKVVNFVAYPEMTEEEINEYDFTDKVDLLFENLPDMIYLITFATDGAKITISASRKVSDSYKPYFLGCDGNHSTEFLLNASPKITEGLYSFIPITDDSSPQYIAFSEAYFEKYSEEAPIFTEHAYDALFAIVLAMEEANSTVSADIASHIRSVTDGGQKVTPTQFQEAIQLIQSGQDIDYTGASGELKFDEYGDINEGLYGIFHVENQQYKRLGTLKYQ